MAPRSRSRSSAPTSATRWSSARGPAATPRASRRSVARTAAPLLHAHEGGLGGSARALREACVFARHNLLKDPPFSRIDVVSCRNVLIYFGSVLQKKAMLALPLRAAARPRLPPARGLREHHGRGKSCSTPWIDKKHKVYSRKPVASRLQFGVRGTEAPAAPPRTRRGGAGVGDPSLARAEGGGPHPDVEVTPPA